MATGQEAFSLDHDAYTNAHIAFSPDGKHLVAGLKDTVWNWSGERRPPFTGTVSGKKDVFMAWQRREAIKRFNLDNQARSITPRHEYLARRGVDYFEQDEWSLAEADFAKAIELGSCDHYMLYCRALLLLHQGQIDAYREFCEHLLTLGIRLQPGSRQFHRLGMQLGTSVRE